MSMSMSRFQVEETLGSDSKLHNSNKNIKQIGSDLSIAVNLVELGKRADHRWIVTMIYGVSSLFVAKYTALVLGCTDGRTDGTDG